MAVYDNVKALCVERKISIAQLERQAGLGNATIAGWKTGMPMADKLARVAQILGTSSEALLDGEV